MQCYLDRDLGAYVLTMLDRRAARAVAIWLLIALAALAPALPAHGQEGTTTISGHVVNGTTGTSTPQDVQVLLWVFRPGAEPEQRAMTADSSGRFVFQDVSAEEVVGYTVTAPYLGIGYTDDLAPGDDLDNLLITVYEATPSLGDVVLTGDSLLLMETDAATRTLSFIEVIQVANLGDRVVMPGVGQEGPMNFLRFPLPAGVVDLEVQSDLPEGEVLQVDRGFAMTNPVPPGPFGIAFTFTVPYTGSRLDISRSLLQGARAFRLLVPDTVGNVVSTALADGGQVVIAATTYQIWDTVDISPGGSVDMVLQGLPQPSLAQSLRRTMDTSWTLALTVALSLALVALLLIGLRITRPSQPVTAGDVPQSRPALAQAIAALDDRYQQGESTEAAYRERRKALKARLLRLAWQEEANP